MLEFIDTHFEANYLKNEFIMHANPNTWFDRKTNSMSYGWFDWIMLETDLKKCNLEWLFRKYFYADNRRTLWHLAVRNGLPRRLNEICEQLNVELDHHDASSDCRAYDRDWETTTLNYTS